MKKVSKLVFAIMILFGLFTFCAFKNGNDPVKAVSIMKVYTTSENDYDGAIIICYSNGKTERTALIANKGKSYLENDKKILAAVNGMISAGHNLIQMASAPCGNTLNITTYIFDN